MTYPILTTDEVTDDEVTRDLTEADRYADLLATFTEVSEVTTDDDDDDDLWS